MSDGRSEPAQGGGTFATGHVVRGGNREVSVTVELICLQPDGASIKYEVQAVGKLIIPAGDLLPTFVVRGVPWVSMRVPCPQPDPAPVSGGAPLFAVNSHTVCRDREGNVKWEADTEPIALAPGEALPDSLVGANLVVTAAPMNPYREDPDGGH